MSTFPFVDLTNLINVPPFIPRTNDVCKDDEFFTPEESDIRLLTCGICCGQHSSRETVFLITCDHSLCRECAIAHYDAQIKNNPLMNISCPFPDCSRLGSKDDRDIHDYFALLIPQLKEFLSQDVVDILEKKLLDWSLQADPNFIWCPECENGMIADEKRCNYVLCDNCSKKICPLCKKIWTQNHLGLTCKQYNSWKQENDPINQTDALEKFLDNFGIECPKCRTQYVKTSGGCLHLKCTFCQYEFCEGCLQPFFNPNAKPKKICSLPNCSTMGFHAHHPRNCFYNLRDWTHQRLQRLLKQHGISYETSFSHSFSKCPLIEQKEKGSKLMDEKCGEEIEPNCAGMCSKHYKQYLAWLVLKNKIDPLPQYSEEELERIISRERVPLPPCGLNYRHALEMIVKGLKENGNLSETQTISDSFAPLLKKEFQQCAQRLEEDIDEDDNYDVEYDEDEFGINLQIDSDSDEDSSLGACARPMEEFGIWTCNFCTFKNKTESEKKGKFDVCEMCSRTRALGLEDYELSFEGRQCIQCTLINEPNAIQCVVCGAALSD